MTQTVTIPTGYKKTEIGVIPKDWEIIELSSISNSIGDGIHTTPKYAHFSSYYFVNGNNLFQGRIKINQDTKCVHKKEYELFKQPLDNNTILMSINGTIGNLAFYNNEKIILGKSAAYIKIMSKANIKYLYYILQHDSVKNFYDDELTGTTINNLSLKSIRLTPIALPNKKSEQTAIAEVLSDTDVLIESLEKLIAKKKAIKQAAMQQLLTGKKRLPGFSGEWETKTINETTYCLDNLRIPLNESQRAKMQGDIPYCGANGILDYVNNYVVDDDIILIAEDGGYFDEYTHRPIAYRIIGKCWVNNHAHILKAKENYDQGFIFYSLVHKNILNYLTSGTRSKLNKSEMFKITIYCPKDKKEQIAIANIVFDMDSEIEKLKQKRDKYILLKQGMMQQLLTGKIRLIKNGDN